MMYSVEIGSLGPLQDNASLAAPDDIILGVMSVRLEDRQQSTVISAPIIDVRAIHSLNNELNIRMHLRKYNAMTIMYIVACIGVYI